MAKSLMGNEKGNYRGPMYSNGNPQADAQETMGPVEGPKGGMKTPDPMGFDVDRNRKGSK